MIYDLAIIGGGINGCGIARDASGRGHSVYLCEMNDLASGTSSLSTKLIHGGLRYLEYYEFRLVREALREREVLWRIAPHIIHPLRFVLPHSEGLRPMWLLRLGLFIYDQLSPRNLLPPTKTLDLTHGALGAPLAKSRFQKGLEYSDCFVDDSRLAVLNACDAANRGAVIETRSFARSARRNGGHWELIVEDTATGAQRTIIARTLVNAAGPWASKVLSHCAGVAPKSRVRLVQGSHIVVPRLYTHDRAYTFQSRDGRIIFAIPFEVEFTLIGTTDRDVSGDPANARATAEEIDYLCTAASANFAAPVKPGDVVWAYSGVRPLYDDGAGAFSSEVGTGSREENATRQTIRALFQIRRIGKRSSEATAASRDYVYELDAPGNSAPLLSIFGGKITTYRRLAEAALEKLAPFLPASNKLPKGWTGAVPLPGGDMPLNAHPALVASLLQNFPFLTEPHAERLARTYGTLATTVLAGATTLAALGEQFGATLSEAEVAYLMVHEWARTADDVVWRRSKLGLRLSPAEVARLDEWMPARHHRQPQNGAPGGTRTPTPEDSRF